MSTISPAKVSALIADEMRRLLDQNELYRVNTLSPRGCGEGDDWIEEELEALKDAEAESRQHLAEMDYHWVKRQVDDFLKERGIELDRRSGDYRLFCREMLKMQVKFLQIEQRRLLGDYSDEVAASPSAPDIRAMPEEEPEGEKISEVIELYRTEQKRGGQWTQKTEAEVLAILRLFVEIVGDRPVKSVDHKMIREYKQTLMKLPANMKKNRRYRDKSVGEVLGMDGVKPMSTTSVNKHLVRVSSLLKYAAKNGFISTNPAEGMQIPADKRDDEYRDVFDDRDLRMLFQSKEYLEDKHTKPYCFWMPVLGLFTGCRLEELSQLHLADIRQEEDVWVIDINNEGEKSLKTKASLRKVPIHPFLLNDLRLVDYVNSLRAKGEVRLFPELKKRRDGYGQTVSKWFARYKERCGLVETGKKKDFHSFRHTFTNALKQNREVEPVLISELVGHHVDSMTMGRYGKRYNPQVLYDAVKALRYNVDLSHLRKSRFAG